MIEVVVRDIAQETTHIRRLTLTAVNNAPLPVFEAGAHIDVHLPNGLVRQYSLINAPGQTETYQLGILKDNNSRGGSRWVHENLRTNDRLHVSAPRNLFPIVGLARRHILFAGGVGVTPILAMARHLSASGAGFEVNYSVRHRHDAAFYGDLAALPGGRTRLLTGGRDVTRTVMREALSQPAQDTHVYVCGPSGYTQTVLDLAREQGWSDSQLHTEAFSSAPMASASGDQAFTLRLARTDATIQVAGDQTVIQALRAHGYDIPFSCEQGICGTCLTRVISGVPDHRDQYLTDEERAANDQFTPCCSRARSPELILDL